MTDQQYEAIDDLRERVRELEAQLAAAREDTARLDWLLAAAREDTARLDWLGYTMHGFVRGTDYSRWLLESPEEGLRTIRQAIDAVRSAE